MQKEQFRKFEKSLLIYMGGETATSPVDGAETVSQKQKKVGAEKSQEKPQFDEAEKKALAALDNVRLDSDGQHVISAQTTLRAKLTANITERFKALRARYDEALEHGEGSDKFKEAKVNLAKKANAYPEIVTLRIIQEGFSSKKIQGIIIDQYLETKGIKLKGFGVYIAKVGLESIVHNDFKTMKDFYKVLDGIINNEQVLEDAIKLMQKDTPKYQVYTGEEAYFLKRFKDTAGDGQQDKLTRFFGNEERGTAKEAATYLAMRIQIKFKKDGKPDSFFDLENGKLYTATDKNWDARLKEICHGDLKDPKKIKSQISDLTKKQDQRDADYKELREGHWTLGDDEVENVGDLKGNALLKKALGRTTSYNEAVNDTVKTVLAHVKNLKGGTLEADNALNTIRKGLDSSKIREGTPLTDLGAIFELIVQLFSGKDYKNALKAFGHLMEGKDPIAITKREARKRYQDRLKTAKPAPEFSKLFSVYTDPKKAEEFFRPADKKKKVEYPELQKAGAEAYVQYKLGENINESMGGKSGLKVNFDGGKLQLSFNQALKGGKTEAKKFTVEQGEKGKFILTDTADAKKPTTTIAGTWSALTAAVTGKPEVKAETVSTAIPETENIGKNGVLKDIGEKQIHDVLDSTKYKTAVIKMGKDRGEGGLKKGDIVQVEWNEEKKTFVVAGQKYSNAGKRLRIYDGDELLKVGAKKAVVASKPVDKPADDKPKTAPAATVAGAAPD